MATYRALTRGESPRGHWRSEGETFEHGGKPGKWMELVDGSSRLPGLTGKSKAQLLDIAKDEGVEFVDDATNAQIVEAIEAARNE
jgi:hypothetical protein